MIEVNGKKLSQDDVNGLFIVACKRGNLARVFRAVEEFKADIDCTDKLGYSRALMYALDSCNGLNSEGEQVVKYLVNRGADVNFKHGERHLRSVSKPYFIYYAANNVMTVSDDLVYFLVKRVDKSTLTHVPEAAKMEGVYESALDTIKRYRPKLYERLIKEKIVTEKKTNRIG